MTGELLASVEDDDKGVMTMKTVRLLIIAYVILLAVALGAMPALAVSNGVNGQAGTATAQFLKIPTSARYYALGGVYAGLGNDAAGLYGQPAASLGVEQYEVTGTHNEWLSDVRHEYLGFVYRLDPDRAVSAQFTYLGIDGLERTEENAAGLLASRGGSFGASDYAVALGYAQRLTRDIRAGGTVKLVRSTIDGTGASAVAFDGGVQWQPDEFLTLGASVTNLGTKMKFISTANRLPLTWRFGAAYRIPTNSYFDVILAADASKPIDARWTSHFGVEFAGDFWALRGGWRSDNALDAGWSAGAGIKVFDALRIDYAYAPGGVLGNTQFFTATYGFR